MLTSDQIRWLEAEVAAGRLASVEDGVRLAVAELMEPAAEPAIDLDWALPLVDEARASLARGEGMTLEEFRNRRSRRRGGS